MKPPSRQRSAPARYDLGPVAHVWTDQEKRRLLKALRAHTEGPLRPELLKKYLPWRDEAEVWTELAEKLTGGLENSVTTAFSQVLTIASTEPLSLLHSVPPKPVDTKNPQYPSSAAHDEQREKLQTVILPSNAEQAPAEQQGFHVDFEKIYKYLSMLSSGSKVPELSPGEAAVVLDLLLSLPEELVFLDIKKLRSHMHKCCMELNAHYAGERSQKQADSSQNANSSGDLYNASLPLYQISNSHPQHKDANSTDSSKADAPGPSAVDWKTLGICPVNSFLLPLNILAQKKVSLD
ncbi:snRNA-activating protein complex subunit 2 isoform X2 [Eublepharis macularius]|uniref:snRNA-activating protein complex subunit 2 isoform X2 n=1 Tax=Eublepharis macularius TaxID=481883 RepID=A0AA97L001_EUBMA|nr:snRNA-activating protein complex subunit 2 isoform X2 [Eublepharis macularius]